MTEHAGGDVTAEQELRRVLDSVVIASAVGDISLGRLVETAIDMAVVEGWVRMGRTVRVANLLGFATELSPEAFDEPDGEEHRSAFLAGLRLDPRFMYEKTRPSGSAIKYRNKVSEDCTLESSWEAIVSGHAASTNEERAMRMARMEELAVPVRAAIRRNGGMAWAEITLVLADTVGAPPDQVTAFRAFLKQSEGFALGEDGRYVLGQEPLEPPPVASEQAQKRRAEPVEQPMAPAPAELVPLELRVAIRSVLDNYQDVGQDIFTLGELTRMLLRTGAAIHTDGQFAALEKYLDTMPSLRAEKGKRYRIVPSHQ